MNPTNALHDPNDLLGLRSHIGRLAVICGVDLSDEENVVRLLEGDFSPCRRESGKAELLRALLVLLCRVEVSAREDFGSTAAPTCGNGATLG